MDLIEQYKSEYHAVMRGATPAQDVDRLLAQYGVKEPLYRQWLIETGGGPIGPDWYDSLSELEEGQRKLAKEGWSIQGFVIGWNGAGNPVALQNDGTILVEDHNFGGIHVIANSFRELLASNICA
jgi:hypothetical protein